MNLKSKAKRVAKAILDLPRAAKLRKLHGIHKGEDAVVIGMGPSLRPEDLDYFKGYRTFACNKIYLGFDKTDWRPDYYSICDLLVAENNRDQIINMDFGNALPIHSMTVRKQLAEQRNALFYNYNHTITDWTVGQPAMLTRDLGKGIHSGGFSVLIDQIQIACLMGFSNIYVVGLDFSFSGGIPTGDRCVSGEVLVSEGEINHFHQDYRKPGETWTVPRMQEQAHAFAFCRAACEASGVNLYNASRKSALEALKRISFDETFIHNRHA